ncbi:TraB/GumN family protein [Pontiella sp.]|uniref:TraB/GumN family protein n=1 Tax=Pontiella sp. TaxID=2837462 RepID=UPI003564C879
MRRLKPIITISCLTLVFTLSALSVQAKSTLWKVSSEKGAMYIQGSAHILKAENYPLAPEIEQAYSNAATLVLEVDMGEMMSPRTQQLILSKAMLKQPDSLQTMLSPEVYTQLETVAAESGIPLAALQQFKPWFATMTLTIVKMKKMGLDENLGLDRHFYTRAQQDGKKVIGLESIDFQIALFNSLAEENPDDFVTRALAEIDQIEHELNRLLEAWETGDLQALETIINRCFIDYPKQYKTFITDRNKAWVRQLDDMLNSGETHMVVVGAGHLPGEEGVINLLKKQGFSVEQL